MFHSIKTRLKNVDFVFFSDVMCVQITKMLVIQFEPSNLSASPSTRSIWLAVETNGAKVLGKVKKNK